MENYDCKEIYRMDKLTFYIIT